MKRLQGKMRWAAWAVLAVFWAWVAAAAADSGDNSLYSLGLENAESCTPEFYYSTLEYDVVVPAGTEELLLNPVPSNGEATVTDISGTELAEDGTGTVSITVEAPNGAQVSYVLHVTSDAPAQTEAAQTEMTQEQQQQQEALMQAQSEAAAQKEAELQSTRVQLQTLLTKNGELTSRINLMMKILYGMVGFCAVLLFLMINQALRNKELKDALKEAKSEAELDNQFARKEQAVQNGHYYSHMPQQETPSAAPKEGAGQAPEGYGSAPQADVQEARQRAGWQDARQAQPTQPAPQPDLVTGDVKEPDIDVEMIDL